MHTGCTFFLIPENFDNGKLYVLCELTLCMYGANLFINHNSHNNGNCFFLIVLPQYAKCRLKYGQKRVNVDIIMFHWPHYGKYIFAGIYKKND